MRISRIGCILLLALSASAVTVQAQENKEPPRQRERENKSAPAERQHNRQPDQPPRERQAAPAAERQHNRPPDQAPRERQAAPAAHQPDQVQHTPPASPSVKGPDQRNDQRPAQRNEQRPEQRNDQRPERAPQVTQREPNNNPPVNRTQPGRTFGNQPGTQPGRTFGNPPGRPAETGRAPSRIDGRPAGGAPRTYTTRTGDVIHRDSRGQVRQVRLNNGTVVYHPPNAPRRVEVVRPGGRVVVASAPGHGYVQRPVVIRNTTIIKRTYVYNGVPTARIFRPRIYNGVSLVVYTPVRYYRPAFYVYAFNPWPRPIVFGWGWAGSPWYGYYGGYFTPYPVYASPSLWLTDYYIAATLQSAYEERMAARAAAANSYADSGLQAPITPEVKQAIADEVRRQIEQERMQGQSAGMNAPDPNIFSDNASHVFVANTPLVVYSSGGGECTIGEGDVVQMNGAPPPNSPSADVIVLSSRGQDCRKGSTVSVGLQDLQEMHNQMLATIDRGMGDLQAKQGQGGLPPLPQGSAGTIDSPYAQEAQPDSNVTSELSAVTQEADRAEQQAIDPASVPTLTLGLSIDEVKSIQGDPEKIVDLGTKKIYVYKDLKITFQDGKVSDIQ